MIEDREHIVQMNRGNTARFRAWLERPSGAFTAGRVTFEAVEGGGVLVRTRPILPRLS